MNLNDVVETDSLKYTKLHNALLGQGSYGKVYQAVGPDNNHNYAIKEFYPMLSSTQSQQNNEKTQKNQFSNIFWMYGLPRSLYQELLVVKEFNHPSLMPIFDIFVENNVVNIVMPLIKCDLRALFKTNMLLDESQVKRIFLDILEGLDHLHSNWILHRDLTPGNIFINDQGRAVLADFGLASIYASQHCFNPKEEVVSLWYRAPELLFHTDFYQNKIDIWSAGCILAELLSKGNVLFKGDNREDQLAKIFSILGTPSVSDGSESDWPYVTSLPDFIFFEYRKKIPLNTIIQNVNPLAIDLLEGLLKTNPLKRPSAKETMQHPWFTQQPLPSEHSPIIYKSVSEK